MTRVNLVGAWVTILVLIPLVVPVVRGCSAEWDRQEREGQAYRQREIERTDRPCVERGGIPIRSAWDGRLVDCKFPPAVSR